jgi:hypothetical protein
MQLYLDNLFIEFTLPISEWFATDAQTDFSKWLYVLTAEEVKDIGHALEITLKAGHRNCDTMTKKDFPLQSSLTAVAAVLDHIENDMGLFVLRGIPAERYSKDEMRMIYWGIGLHLGTAVSQSSKGDVLGDVKNFGDFHSPHSAAGRGYMSRMHLSFHTDSSDVVSLMVLNTAKSGGLSMICSSIAVRNQIARKRPDLLKVLFEDFYWSWKGHESAGSLPYYKQPIFSEEGGRFACRFIPTHIYSAQEFSDVPRLTENQKEAISMIDETANDDRFHFSMMFEPGDIQFLNNHITFHARTEFEDDDSIERRRHLLRMWLCPPNSRRLSPALGEFYHDQRPGAVRGGFPSRTGQVLFETIASEV